jgi:heme/copper-type cytochrome/quinol oxidase subunit 4
MSAGHSLRRQNYSFAAVTPAATSHSTFTMYVLRFVLSIIVAIVTAVALDVAVFATISLIVTGR